MAKAATRKLYVPKGHLSLAIGEEVLRVGADGGIDVPDALYAEALGHGASVEPHLDLVEQKAALLSHEERFADTAAQLEDLTARVLALETQMAAFVAGTKAV